MSLYHSEEFRRAEFTQLRSKASKKKEGIDIVTFIYYEGNYVRATNSIHFYVTALTHEAPLETCILKLLYMLLR